MKNMKKLISFLMAVVTVLNMFGLYSFVAVAEGDDELLGNGSQSSETVSSGEGEETYIENMVHISCESAVNKKITFKSGEEPYVTSTVDESIKDSATYKWQLKTPDGEWAYVDGYVLPYAVITGALITSAILEDGSSYLRCVVTSDGVKYVSDELEIVLEETPVPMMMSAAPEEAAVMSVDESAEDEPSLFAEDTFQLVIDYKYRHGNASSTTPIDGKTAANTFTVTIPSGGFYTGTIATPPEIGYLPYVKAGDGDIDQNYVMGTPSAEDYIDYYGQRYVLANSIEFYKVSDKVHITVYYIPQNVDYIVRYYEQMLYSDEYVLAESEIKTGVANAAVGEGLSKAREGFYANPYEIDESISEDGSYVLDIYYDRLYYLVDFDTDDNNHYVRYNTQIMLPTPYQKGYSFQEWNLKSVTDENDAVVGSHSYAETAPAGTLITVQHNLSYTASWTPATTSYAVVYWLENADSDKYDVWYTHKIEGTTGDKTIAGSDNITQYITLANGYTQAEVNDVTSTYPYLTYNSNLTDKEQKTLQGDGTTTINIYYTRKVYTLKFYYAIEKPSGSSSTYHVIGGSTYYFGGNASGTAKTDPVAAMRQYASGSYMNQTGQVTSLPTLNEKGAARGYTNESVTDPNNNYKYHYLSFSAKFGADITELWPCDVFKSVERSSRNTHGQWSGKTAFVSAWNGENRVRYTQDSSVNNGNQTIKGKYTQLDANLLWNDPKAVDKTEVSYACFWENGANISWSVPELYRYNIYLPLLPNQVVPEEDKKVYNGVTYYLADSYDTCDDSSPSAQTRPGLVGFVANGRDWSAIDSYDTSLYREAYQMNFYYSRNIYYISFNDQHGNIVKLSVPYGTYLDDHDEADHVPVYPSDFEEGECEFAGWFYDEACENQFHHNINMPAKNIQLYAKWQTLSYNVSVYFDTEKTIPILYNNASVLFGTLLAEPDYRTQQNGDDNYKSLLFIGWYYMDGAEEKRFDFNTMPIKKDMEIYAVWTSEVLVDFLINYVTVENGEYIKIADSRSGKSLVGFTKTFVALTGSDLGDDYDEGYFPEVRSHSMTMSANETENVYTFIYTASETMTYTVKHIFNSTGFTSILGDDSLTLELKHTFSGESVKSSAASVSVLFREGINEESIVNAAIKQNGGASTSGVWDIVKTLSPDSFQKELTLTTNQDNLVTFEWTFREGGGVPYQTVHYYQNVDGEYVADSTIMMGAGTVGNTVDAIYPSEINGEIYELNESLTEESGTLSSLFNADGTIAQGLILRVYYARKSYSYTIHYYKNNTTTSLADSVTGSAFYGTVLRVSDWAKHIDGYVISNNNDDDDDNFITVGSIPENNVLKCFYTGLEVYYRYQIIGTGASFDIYNVDGAKVGEEPQKATLTVATGHFVNGWHYVVGNGEEQELPTEWLTNVDAKTTIVSPAKSPVEWAGKTIYIYAEVLPETRRFVVEGAATLIDPQAFIFHLEGKAETNTEAVNVTFVIVGNDYVDICELPFGDYTISMLGWSWRYGTPTVQFGDKSIEFVNNSASISLNEVGNVTFRYSGTPNDKWLTDETAKYITISQSN